MTSNHLYTRRDKLAALAAFRIGKDPATVAAYLRLDIDDVKTWFSLYEQHDNTWAKFDDQDASLRFKALELFKKGYGYRKVSKALSVTDVQTRQWLKEYQNESDNSSISEKPLKKRYTKAEKNELLNRYAVHIFSKNAFCRKNHLSVLTLEKWLSEERKLLQ